jgi:hypothetical protein
MNCLGFVLLSILAKKRGVKQSNFLIVTYFGKKNYMHKTILMTCLAVLSLPAFSQKIDLVKFEKERIRYSKNSMLVLGGWSAANIVVSGIATKTHNPEMRAFHQMNVMWGGINLAIAGLGYWGTGREKVDNPTLADILKRQNRIEKTYLINAGLDVVYIGAGLLMNKTSDNQKNPEKFKGYGNSFMVQGGFLLLYDAIIYSIHHKHGKQLKGMGEKLTFNAGPGAVSLTYNF